MDSDPGEKLGKGKREVEDAIEMAVLSAKKQKVEEKVSEIKSDRVEFEKDFEAETSCYKPEQWVNVSAEDGHAVSVLEDKSNVLEENTLADENKYAVAIEEGHKAATLKNNDSTGDSDSLFQDETSMAEDIAATIRAPALLIEEDPVAPPKKKDESSKNYDSCSKDETVLDEDVIGANLSPPAPSIQKSLVSIQKKDDSWTDEFDSVHEGKTDDNAATGESIPLLLTKKENGSNGELELDHETNEELELDYETSSSDDDPQTPATPTEKTTGAKTLFVGNLSFSIWKEDVEDFFKAAGEVVGIRFGMNSDETFKGYGYVEFASAEAAEKAFRELNGKELLRRRVRLNFAKERAVFTPYTGQDAESSQKVCKDQGHTVFVRGFSKADCQDKIRRSLEEHFGSCGEISRVSVPKDEDGCARSIAYIDFKDKDAFNRALALNGSAFREGTLSVIEAKPRGGSHDNTGIIRGYGRNGGRYSWRDFSGRRGVCEGGGGRSDWQNFSVRRGGCEGGGRNDFRDFGGGRSNWQSFGGRRGVCEGGDGRSDWQNFSGRRGAYVGGGGRRVWQGFNGRSGVGETGSWSGSGVWRGRGVWQNFSGRGGLGSFSGRSNGWFGGGGSREQPTPNIIAAPAPGKREAEDAIQIEMESAKKQKVEGKINVSAEDGHVVSLLEEKNNVVEEDTSTAESKPAVTSEEGHIAANSEKDESNDVSNSFFQDETSLIEDVAASIRAPVPLIGKDTVSPSKKKDESCKDSDSCSKDETISEKDVTGGNLSPPAPSIQKSLVSFQKKDDSRTYEFYSAHESNTDDNVTTTKTAPTEKGPLVSCKKKDEPDGDNNKNNEVTAESIPLLSAKENGNNEELELDHETKEKLALDYENSSSNDDHQTPAIPTELTTGGKILFVGNLSLSIEQEDVEHFFKSAGEVNIRFGMNSDKTLKGYAHVEFASAEAAEKALHELNGKELLHRRVRLDFAKPRASLTPYNGQDTEYSQKGWKDQGKTLYVCGFNKADGQDEIRRSLEEHFGSCGEITRVSVPKGEDGCVRGIAFIDFKDKDAFNRALTLNGSEFGEGTLSVAEAKANPRGDSRDNSGVFRGYARNGGRYGWQDFGGRRGGCEGGRRGDWQSSSGRSSWHEFGLQNFSGRSDFQNFSGRRGVYEGGRSVWRGGFSGRSNTWSGGGGSREQPTPNIVAASGNNEECVEDQTK